ncbi:MAG: bifunctional phosphoribosylaminoimidazolecarboxamide formyltransferase/IMP cyclohydrolase [Bacillota bacterium]
MKRAFLSVSDKTGLVDFARELIDLGYQLVSTGGTQAALEQAGLQVTNVSAITGFPECLDGRVKTLHPAVHAGLLAMRQNAEHMDQIDKLGIKPIDIVIVNLYPFKQTILKPDVTFEEAIENIDIGGPTMLRAAAKNHASVTVVVDAADYARVTDEIKEYGDTLPETRLDLCAKVFAHTAAYDALIAQYLAQKAGFDPLGGTFTATYEKVQDMRYGENPHQQAAFYREIGFRPGCLTEAVQLHGKELSYNNINDTNGALELLHEFGDETAVIAVKHANPCGVGLAPTLPEAYTKAYEADPVSIFGGIVATNAVVDEETAKKMHEIFLEIIVAPDFSPEALAILTKKKNIRLLKLPTINAPIPKGMLDMKKVRGGLLVQTIDDKLFDEKDWKVVTRAQPTPEQIKDAIMAFKVNKHVKSNGIAVCKDGKSLGIGAGQVNRIWAAEQALERGGDAVKGASMASDAYFPFPDCVEAAAKAGIACIIQPGGSKNDHLSIEACDAHGISMIFTGMRHFKH